MVGNNVFLECIGVIRPLALNSPRLCDYALNGYHAFVKKAWFIVVSNTSVGKLCLNGEMGRYGADYDSG